MGNEDKTTVESKMIVQGTNSMLGTCESYVLDTNFGDYLEGLKNYFALNKIEEDVMKVRLLVNLIGTEASAKIIKAVKPKVFTDYSYDKLVEICEDLFGVQRNSIVEHFKFNNRFQKEGETLGDFALELQAMAEHCEFGEFLDTALRDRFIAGIRNTKTKKMLLGMSSKKKFGEIVTAAKGEELLQVESERMHVDENSNVNAVQGNQFDRRANSRNRGGKMLNSGGNFRARKEFNPTAGKCYRCQRYGHYARNCYTNLNTQNGGINQNGNGSGGTHGRTRMHGNTNAIDESFGNLNLEHDERDKEDATMLIAQIEERLGEKSKESNIEMMKVQINDSEIDFEVDTGSKFTVISKNDYEKFLKTERLIRCELPLSVVSGERLKLLGKVEVWVGKKSKSKMEIHVIETKKNFLPLLGRVWLNKLCPNWRKAFLINKTIEEKLQTKMGELREKIVKNIKVKYSKVFDNNLKESIKGVEVNIRMKKNARGFVHKAYTVPFKMKEKVEKAIDDLVKEDILEKVEHCEWASPMVIVKKPNGEIRPCLDGSKTINPFIETNHYPIPQIDDLLVNKSNANWFTVLDLKGAYTQLKVNEISKQILGVNTIKGLYVYKRLPFGVKPAAQIFQSVMDKILEGIENVQAYIDDILIWDKTIEGLEATMEKVFKRLYDYNVKINGEKCQWMIREVKYLGHKISCKGIEPNSEKVEAIMNAPVPKNVTELKSFIGMINFYSKFITNLNGKLSSLYVLLQKGQEWNWTLERQKVFEECKKELCGEKILAHYDLKKEIIINCDASNEGISGILSHKIDGKEKPVFFVSRTLTNTEKSYPILHREALAIVFSMEKFFKYIYGNHVTIYTDHKPLLGIFNKKKGEPAIVASRLQRYIVRLASFDYEVKYRKGAENGNADALSRLPIKEPPSEIDLAEEKIFSISSIIEGKELFLDVRRIKNETDKDKTLSKVRDAMLNGWGERVDENVKEWKKIRDTLSLECGCVTMADRVVIPRSLQTQTLKILHTNHGGIVKMKSIARKYVYWQGINKDIEAWVDNCEACQILCKNNAKKVYGKWPETKRPFERIHLDFFHFKGKTFLIIIDAYSKWMDVKQMTKTNAVNVIKELLKLFEIFGYVEEVVSDNGPPFGSNELREFLESKGIKITHSPPYHPQSNGLAERAVQTIKTVLRKMIIEKKSHFQLETAINEFLKNYRNVPTTEKEIVPAHKVFSFKPRTEITCLRSDKNLSPINEIEILNKKEKRIEFKKNDKIWYMSSVGGHAISYRGTIVKRNSELTYWIKIGNGVKLAHVNQLRKYQIKRFSENNKVFSKKMFEENKMITKPPEENILQPETPLRRSKRERQAPTRYRPA